MYNNDLYSQYTFNYMYVTNMQVIDQGSSVQKLTT